MLNAGRLKKVRNLDQKRGAAENYYAVLVKNSAGMFETLLFTELEVVTARYRVRMNPEDELLPARCDRLLLR